MNGSRWMATLLAIGLAGCGAPERTAETDDDAMGRVGNEAALNGSGGAAADGRAVAILQTADGRPAGTATVTADAEGLVLSLRAEGLPPGQHGAHVHATGRCDPPAFESAGPHWNPQDRQHGLENPQGQHAGDMPNLMVGEDGRGTLEYRLVGGSFDGLLDEDGSAMVIHAAADDQRTDPSGNSGDRIACGLFVAG